MHPARLNAGDGVYGISVAVGPKGLLRYDCWDEHGVGRSFHRDMVETLHARWRRDGHADRVAIFCRACLHPSRGADRVYCDACLSFSKSWRGGTNDGRPDQSKTADSAVLPSPGRNGHGRGAGDES